jgi:ketosteroid isomerase-like protein
VTAVKQTLRRFSEALASGDTKAVASLLAADAVVLEGGGELQTRQRCLEHHLGDDIRFAQAVPTVHDEPAVTVQGDIAWASSTRTSRGQVGSKPLSLQGSEPVVLSRLADGWVIRAIHWSSHNGKLVLVAKPKAGCNIIRPAHEPGIVAAQDERNQVSVASK